MGVMVEWWLRSRVYRKSGMDANRRRWRVLTSVQCGRVRRGGRRRVPSIALPDRPACDSGKFRKVLALPQPRRGIAGLVWSWLLPFQLKSKLSGNLRAWHVAFQRIDKTLDESQGEIHFRDFGVDLLDELRDFDATHFANHCFWGYVYSDNHSFHLLIVLRNALARWRAVA